MKRAKLRLRRFRRKLIGRWTIERRRPMVCVFGADLYAELSKSIQADIERQVVQQILEKQNETH